MNSTIVFLCVANSARSQMAEGLARYLFGDQCSFASAGSAPTKVNPLAIEAMEEIGIDITQHKSQGIADVLNEGVGTVITLCADEVCPVVNDQVTRHHWPFPDPSGKDGFEIVRDQIKSRLLSFGQEQGWTAKN